MLIIRVSHLENLGVITITITVIIRRVTNAKMRAHLSHLEDLGVNFKHLADLVRQLLQCLTIMIWRMEDVEIILEIIIKLQNHGYVYRCRLV